MTIRHTLKTINLYKKNVVECLMKKKIIWILSGILVFMNFVAFQQAYTFTHFTQSTAARTKDARELSTVEKISILFKGVDNPRPANKRRPQVEYETIHIESTGTLACWRMPVDNAKGTVVMFHGYAGEKSSLLDRAYQFQKLGYTVWLIDFLGSGESAGNSTTVGYAESKQVQDVYKFISNSEKDIVLFGTSMGAAAILKAQHDNAMPLSSIILECPFGSLYKTVGARFRMMGLPEFPMSALLCFWGGAQHGYWAFSYNPASYASDVHCPVLLLYGEQDERVSREETDNIYTHLRGPKVLHTYPQAGHDVFIEANKTNWINDVSTFLQSHHP